MLSGSPISLAIIAVHLLSLLYLFLSGPVEPHSVIVGVLYGLGVLLGLWTFWTLRSTSWRITPEVANGAILIENGPYTYIRHPIYLALILVGIGLLLNYFTPLRLSAFIIMTVDLLVKIYYEEKHLHRSFSRYRDYMKKTYKLLPFIY
jgi:protein-S-isoprenylcysteine O-methyltransferase Ste14